MWTCPNCHSKVDATFEVCWQCGTTEDGVVDPDFVRADDAGPINDPPVTDEALVNTAEVEATDPFPFGPDAELVECYTAEDRMQAHFIAAELLRSGIPAVGDSHEPNESLGGLLALPKVWVRAEDLAKARVWLEDFETKMHAPRTSSAD